MGKTTKKFNLNSERDASIQLKAKKGNGNLDKKTFKIAIWVFF